MVANTAKTDAHSTIPSLTLAAVRKFRPCKEAYQRVSAILPKRGKIDARQAAEAGCTLRDLMWIANAVAGTDNSVERRVRHWMADCAARVLHIYESVYPDDMRVRAAVITARRLAEGEIIGHAARSSARAAASNAAWAAAWDAEWDARRAAAWDAARGAGSNAAWAAARAAACDAARAAARAAAWAAAWDATSDPALNVVSLAASNAACADAGGAAWAAARVAAWEDAREAAKKWQLERLVYWLSEENPVPLHLPLEKENLAWPETPTPSPAF